MKKILQILVLLTLGFSLTACMTTQPFSMESKRAIHTVSVDKNVKVPTDMYYLGPGFGYAGLFSMLPGVSSSDKLKQLMGKHNIQVTQMVRNRFIADIQRDTHLKVIDGKADANLQIEIKLYGFSIPQGYSFEVVPIMIVEAKLVQNSHVVWTNHYRVLALFEGMPSHKPDELIAKPDLMAAALNQAAEKVASRLVKELN